MKKMIFEYDQTCQHYHFKKMENGGIIHLTTFLTDDVGCDHIQFYREWLNNPDDIEGGGNYSHLDKEGNIIKIWFEYDWFHETPGAEYFETTIQEMNYILDRWQEACEKKPKRIIFTRENGKMTIDF